MNAIKTPAALLVALALGACSTLDLGSVSKTAQLQQGMSPAQVQAVLGAPGSVQQGEAGQVWKYSLHEYYKGWVPHYLLFTGEPRALRSWVADEAEYRRTQEAWGQALKPALDRAAQQRAGNTGRAAGGSNCQRGTVEDRTACNLAELSR